MPDDAQLLRRYLQEKSEPAFAALVRRHIDLVYSVALRQVGGDAHLAEDVVQEVFTALARKAGALGARPTLTGWLYRSAHFAASDIVRGERRRRAREQEAHAMQEIHASPAGEIDWEKVRPAIDAAIAELEERDRDAVSLRFFDECSFADIGGRLQLTENAARMRVERALDKLYATLARRGVKSTAAALGLALANQAATAAPAALATSVSSVALAGGAVAATGLGAFAFFGTAKFVAGLAGAAAVVAGGTAVMQHQRARDALAALASAEHQRQGMQRQAAEFAARVKRAERRAVEVEKDNGELLKAIEAQRVQVAARAAQADTAARLAQAEAVERTAMERTYQQELAKRRANEAKERARLQSLAVVDRPTRRIDVEVMLAGAEELYARGDFQGAIQTLNVAVESKPADVPLPERTAEMRERFKAQNTRLPVSLVSDAETWVMVLGALGPTRFQANTIELLPGNYEVIGRRTGYGPVNIPLQVRQGAPPPVVSVACTVRVVP